MTLSLYTVVPNSICMCMMVQRVPQPQRTHSCLTPCTPCRGRPVNHERVVLLQVLYEDEDIACIVKPPGIPTHVRVATVNLLNAHTNPICHKLQWHAVACWLLMG